MGGTLPTRRVVALIDGEHYPPVVRDAIGDLRRRGMEPLAALLLGGTEKVAGHGADIDVGVPTTWVQPRPGWTGAGVDPVSACEALVELIRRVRPDAVVDLSDEPVIDQRRRLRLASYALANGVAYEGADFRFDPPPRPRLADRPSVAVIGTGKRTGKTAVAGEMVRLWAGQGRTPVVVAMGRGGPPEPVVVEAGSELSVAALLAVAEAGGHAASDFYEDALTTGAATVGARRCGGGLAGAVAYSNVPLAIEVASGLAGDLLVLEGSGAAIPPAHADATALVVPADADVEQLAGYLGAYRVLMADLVLVTMCEPPRASPHQVESVLEAIRSISRSASIVRTVFRPEPLGELGHTTVFFATTAPAAVSANLATSLEERFGCEVVGVSSQLADRPALRAALEAAPVFDVLLVELKAAAVDVAARMAAERGARVVFCDNRPQVVQHADTATSMADEVERLARLAEERFAGGQKITGHSPR